MWIIQDILSASSLVILCGSRQLTMDNLQFRSDGAKPATEFGNKCSSKPAYLVLRQRFKRPHGDKYSLHRLIQLCSECDSQCVDIRDRIYGLLSLVMTLTTSPPTIPKMCFTSMSISSDLMQGSIQLGDFGFPMTRTCSTMFNFCSTTFCGTLTVGHSCLAGS